MRIKKYYEKIRVIIVTVLVLSLFTASISMSWAQESEDNDIFLTANEQDVVNLIDGNGMSVDSISENEKGEVVLDIDNGVCESAITIEKAEDDSIILDIVEGEKEDTLELCDDGRIILDGDEVEVNHRRDYSMSEEAVLESQNIASLNAPQHYSFVTTSPYGKYSDYSKFAYTEVEDLILKNQLNSYTWTARVMLICELISPWAGVITTAQLVAQIYSDNAGNTKICSARHYVYYHNKGFMIKSGLHVKQHSMYFYKTRDATGTLISRKVGYERITY